MYQFKMLKNFINPKIDPDLGPVVNKHMEILPTLWLLGKTGAGKSSLIQAVTGNSSVQIGNGFAPCTETAYSYDFPESTPLFRFLDTRGLGDPDYDPHEDIRTCENRSHALIVVMKIEEPEQGQVLKALSQIRKSGRIKHAFLVHTGIHQVSGEHERQQCIAHNQEQVQKAWSQDIDSVQVDFEPGHGTSMGVEQLQDKLAEFVPVIAQFKSDRGHIDQEKTNFARLKTEILWYAGVAGASDATPVVGTVTVPGIQAKMMHCIAGRYGLEWNKRTMAEFMGAMGAGFGAQYAAKLGIRQLVKLVPVYGQTVGSATATVVSFSSTYALGRVACKYIYHKSKGETVSSQELKDMYKDAFKNIQGVARSETNNS